MIQKFPISKYKVYIDDPSEAPDDVEVQEGAQGGLYYEVEPSDDGVEEPEPDDEESITDNSFEFDGYEVEEFDDNIGVSITEMGIGEGDKIFVGHPGGDYIAEVTDAEGGWSDWRIEFGNGSYHLDPDTTSTPLGVVTAEPELGPLEELEDVDEDELLPGDIVAWEDDGGFVHYDDWAAAQDETGYVLGRVEEQEPQDPTEMYDMPDPDEYGEEEVEFNNDLAKAIDAGDATELPAYKYMSNAGSIVDEDMAIDAYKSILNNGGNKTQKERMERRLRGMGLDPDDYKETEVNPEEVPGVRKDTVFSDIESGTAIDIAANMAVTDSFAESNFEAWNDFFDHLTQPELQKSLEKAVEEGQTLSGVNTAKDPTNLTGDEDYSPAIAPQGGIDEGVGAVLSRMESGSYEKVDSLIEQGGGDELANHAASFMKSAEDRRKAYEEHGVSHRWGRIQFDESLSEEERVKRMADIHTGTTSQLDAYGLRAGMYGTQGIDNDKVAGFNRGRPIAGIEPSEEFKKAIEWNQENKIDDVLNTGTDEDGYALAHGMSDNIDPESGTITLYRGVKSKVTGHAPLESWSTDQGVAQSFDGSGIMKVEASKEDIAFANDINHTHHPSEEEWTLIGDSVAGKVDVIQGDPIEMMAKIDLGALGEDQFMIAPNSEWVEAAIFDDMYDPGMGPRMEAAREEDEGGSDDSEGDGKGIAQKIDEIAQKAAERVSKEGMSSGTAGVGSATYGGAAHAEDEDEDEKMWKADNADWLAKADASIDEIDKILFDAYEKMVWWNLDGEKSLEKAPAVWSGDERVPDFVKRFVEEALDKGAFWSRGMEALPDASLGKLKDVFEESLTQPQGWSLSSLVDNIQEQFPSASADDAELVARNETAALLNTGREQAYDAAEEEGEEFKFYWSGPKDHRTTDICRKVKEQVHPNHGGSPVSKEELKKILLKYAKEYRGKGGTPERVEEWLPHYQCRHTFIRSVHL